jgi:putative PIN family toxin of toxin-antitoxin system
VRIVLDTNVVVSALIWGGTPDRLVQMAIDGDIELCTSPELLSELQEVLLRAHLASRLGPRFASVAEAVALYGELAVSVSPTSAPRVVPDDADDDQVVAAAVAARVDLIVSGDRHLLVLGSHRTIRIVTPAEALRLIAAA